MTDAFARQSSQTSEAVPSDDLPRRALSAFFSNNRKALIEVYNRALAAEHAAGDQRDLRPSDSILYLVNNTLSNREELLAAQEAAAKQARNEELRLRIVLSLLDDEYYELNQLKGENRFNKFSRIFNRASSSLSKLALFQPQDAAQLLLDTAYSLKKARSTTERERMMVFIAKKFLLKYPDAPERQEVEELLHKLNDKLHADWVRKEIAAGEVALDQANYRAAIFHLENATILDPTNADAAKLLAQAHAEVSAVEQAQELAVSVADSESRLSAADSAIFERAVRSVVVGKNPEGNEHAPRDPTLAASIAYARAALHEQDGAHDAALAMLADIASLKDNPVAKAAQGLLANPAYNLGTAFDEAVAQIQQERKKFIMTGKRTPDETAYVMGSATIQNVGSSPANVPALFFTDMLVRGVAEKFRTQVAVDAAIDAGAAYLRRYPGSPRAKEIAQKIAELSARSSDYSRSRVYLKLAGDDDPKKLAKIRENEARRIYEFAIQTNNPAERKRNLETLVRDYPESKIAATAQRELEKLQPTLGEGGLVLTRKMLATDPELVRALGLDPALVDGQKRNGEIAEQGIAIAADGQRYAFKMQDGEAFLEQAIPKNRRDWILARGRALLAASALGSIGKQVIRRRVLPVEIEGGAGSSGVEVAPKLLPYPDRTSDARYFK